ncbi:N-acetyltransferase [Flavobacterium sp. JAS]|uniref:GNAT family N-acetyltransferase n=1 Tax=Flavobacterium sp. JAS TaxID=2897329 RepID=UPI001E51BC33|nr:GNAT family N-acetyltransferase [Flavobacterium sp. JAS]MCD0469865.1 GNAT family N-acetyltransferase [Flavobacterium sp. JAS]
MNTQDTVKLIPFSSDLKELGIGNQLLIHCLAVAEENSIKNLLLYSNRKLLPAMPLYKKIGFTEIPLEDEIYERANIKMKKAVP